MATSSDDKDSDTAGNAAPDRDDLEGAYTQTDPETPETRTVHGQYTESDGHEGPDPSVEGTYIGADHDGEEPLVRSSKTRHGNYPKAEH